MMMGERPTGLSLSKVAPTVETNLERVGELVKLMQSGGAGLTETQTSRLFGYLGTLDDMRKHIGTMSDYYQSDDKVLFKLLALLDRIDESMGLVQKSTFGFTHEEMGENADGTLSVQEEESILHQSITNPVSLMVSTTHVLGVSGLLLPRLFEEIVRDDEDYDDETSEWDHPLTENDIAQLDTITLSSTPADLKQSFMEEGASLYAEASSSSSKSGKRRGKCDPTLCKICYEEYTDWSKLRTLTNCDHIYCTECIAGHLTALITSGGVLDLGCPDPSCDAEVNIIDLYSVLEQTTLDKYERFLVLASLRADPNVRWCPRLSCSAAIKGPPKDESLWLTCGTCQLQVCFACGDERHDPATCGKEAKDLIAQRNNTVREAEELFEQWHTGKPSDVKACPKCKSYIEKNQGCNHMTCRSCKHQFCWLCLVTYESNHFNNEAFPDCKGKQYWYPPAIPDAELAQRYNWIYFPPTYQYAGVDDGPVPNNQPTGPTQAQRIRSTAKKVGVFVGVGVAVATLGIPAAIIGGPIYGVFKLHKRLKAKRRRENLAIIRRNTDFHNELF